MSGLLRAGLLFGLAATLAFVGGLLLPIGCVNVLIAFASVIALGWGAGYTAAKTSGAGRGQGVGRGLTAGAIAGLIALIGTLIALIVLGNVLRNQPGFEAALRQQLELMMPQNPEVGDIDLEAVTGLAFVIAGFGCGLINFLLMLLGGALGGLMWRGAQQAAYAAPESTPPPPVGSYGTPPLPGQDTRRDEPDDPYRSR
ncbi:hypothetical protein [Kallotenue papyrolyticum]|uniref:hypothetical protein n=1 Tax=Kallotenue papyrolyticum TaxID=1325125 RepID=UPI0004B59F20|nr:hypothetical protein [Kallotenue papyrolyticum]